MKGKLNTMNTDTTAMREAAEHPDVLQQLREMGRELDKTPEFVSKMLDRLDRVIGSTSSKHDH